MEPLWMRSTTARQAASQPPGPDLRRSVSPKKSGNPEPETVGLWAKMGQVWANGHSSKQNSLLTSTFSAETVGFEISQRDHVATFSIILADTSAKSCRRNHVESHA
jgi:hypothetical protein